MALVAGALVLAGCDSNGGAIDSGPDTDALNAYEALSLPQYNAGTFEQLLSSDATNIGPNTIADASSVTVFAPGNTAFAPVDNDALRSNSGLLQRVLNYHIVTGQTLNAGDIGDQDVTTAEGSSLSLSTSDGEVLVGPNGAAVNNPDIEAANGVVHLIDQLLLNRTTVNERLDITANLDTLNDAVKQAGLDGSLSGSGPFTVFAPSDNVVGPYHMNDGTLPAGAENVFDLSQSNLADLLQYHVVSGDVSSSDLLGKVGGTQSTLAGSPLNVDTTSGGTLTINGAPVTTADVQVANGRIHYISDLLLEQTTTLQRAQFTKALDSLTTNAVEAGVASTLGNTSQDFTVFAPANGAFGAIDDLSGEAFQGKTLTYHVHQGDQLTASDIMSQLETQAPFKLSTVQGTDITVDTSSGGAITLNGKEIIASTDIQTSNGVVHVVSDVLRENLNAVERASVEPNFNTLESLVEWIDAVQNIGLNSDLTASGPYTVFAPTNSSFTSLFDPAALMKAFDVDGDGDIDSDDDYSAASNATQDTLDLVTEVLDYHVVSGRKVTSADVAPGGTDLQTDDNNAILTAQLDGSSVRVNPTDLGAGLVLDADVQTSNGVIHGIDGVQLQGLHVENRAHAEPSFELLEKLLEMAGTNSDLTDNTATYTVFAPTNQAILDRFDDNGDGTLQSGELPSNSEIQDVLDYHVVPGTERKASSFTATPDSLTTDQGSKKLGVKTSGGNVVVNDSVTVVAPNADVSNGVIHGVDTVLLP